MSSVSEFNEFEPRLKSAKNRFQLSAGLNFEKLNTILSEITIFEPRHKFKPQLKFFKFGLRQYKFRTIVSEVLSFANNLAIFIMHVI